MKNLLVEFFGSYLLWHSQGAPPMEGTGPTILWVALWGPLCVPLDLGNGQGLIYREFLPGFYLFYSSINIRVNVGEFT